MDDSRGARLTAVAALAEPTRRRLYDHVVRSPQPLSRDDVAGATGVPRPTTAFHLDRLVADGLLDVHYERRSGRTGPGAGRPAKLYRRTARDISVSLPERRYDLAGRVMAEAITIAGRDRVPVDDALRTAADATGRRLGQGAEAGAGDPIDAVSEVLARSGYEPRTVAGEVVLANCPFHRLAVDYTELMCGMNRDLIGGLLDVVCPGTLSARLNPGPDRCCVTVGEAHTPGPSSG